MGRKINSLVSLNLLIGMMILDNQNVSFRGQQELPRTRHLEVDPGGTMHDSVAVSVPDENINTRM